MKNVTLADSELTAYSGEHMLYELQYFWYAASELCKMTKPTPQTSVLIESFGIQHRRCVPFLAFVKKKNQSSCVDEISRWLTSVQRLPSATVPGYGLTDDNEHHRFDDLINVNGGSGQAPIMRERWRHGVREVPSRLWSPSISADMNGIESSRNLRSRGSSIIFDVDFLCQFSGGSRM